MGKKVVVENNTSSLEELLRELGMTFDEEVYKADSVEYRVYLEGDKLTLVRSSYGQAEKNGVYRALKTLENAGLINILDDSFFQACTSETCYHNTHDDYSFEKAIVEIL